MSIVNYWDRNWKSWWQINVCIIQMVLCIWSHRTETKRKSLWSCFMTRRDRKRKTDTERKTLLTPAHQFSIIFFLCMQNWLKQYHWWFFSLLHNSCAQRNAFNESDASVCSCRQSECATQDSANGKWFSFYHLRVGLFSQDMTFYAAVNFSYAILCLDWCEVRADGCDETETHTPIANRR